MYGELNPTGGGDSIPLLKTKLLIGRRESCDIVLRFANVSAHHCEMTLESGYWYVRDLNSRNGTKVNGSRVTRKRLDPGDVLAVAKHTYEMNYTPADLGATGPPPPEEEQITEILTRSLLDRAGLERRQRVSRNRYDVTSNAAGQIRHPDTPI